MNQTLENKIENKVEQYTDWNGPNYNNNGYNLAKYRKSNDTVDLEGIQVPSRMEALNWNGKWEKHPVVFLHYGTYEATKNKEGILVIFQSQGYTSRTYNPLNDRDKRLYERAEALGLTNGNTLCLKSFPKDD